jgi:CheY-like chemotaxis protein
LIVPEPYPLDRRRARNTPKRPLVLIVEGHEDTRALYALALSGMGFDVIAESACSEAHGRAWQTHPDIIVTELGLRQQDGWQLLRDLHDDPRTRDIPIIVISADARPSVSARVEHEGAAACLLKPCLPDVLAVQLRHVLASAGQPGALQADPLTRVH